MKPSLRRRLMRGTVVAIVLWPLVHLAAVERFQIDPWEFFGWAMYSQPAARIQVRVDVLRADERKPLRAMGALGKDVVDFARRRTLLGRLASAEGLAMRIFESDASIDRVELVLRRVRLDHSTSFLIGQDETLSFERASP